MTLKPIMSDAEIKRRKRLQGRISVTTSTLGLTALATKGAGTVARGARFGAKGAKFARAADKTATNTVIASGGIGGLGGYNFAAYTKAESRKRATPVKKSQESAMLDFGLSGVHHGLASNFKDERDVEDVSKAQKQASAGRHVTAQVFTGTHGLVAGRKGHKLRAFGNEAGGWTAGAVVGGAAGAVTRVPAVSALGSTAGAITGTALGVKRAQKKGHYKVQKAVSDSPTYKATVWNKDAYGHPAAKNNRKILRRERLKGQAKGELAGAAVGALAARGGAAVRSGAYAGKFSRALTGNKTALKAGLRVGAHELRRKPGIGTAAAAVGGGLVGSNIGDYKGTKKALKRPDYKVKKDFERNTEIFKAYDPERSRQRRLDHSATGFAAAAGATAAGAAIHGKKAYKPLKAIASTARGKSALTHGGKAAVLTGTAAGAAVVSDRLRSYKTKRGGSFTPLRNYNA